MNRSWSALLSLTGYGDRLRVYGQAMTTGTLPREYRIELLTTYFREFRELGEPGKRGQLQRGKRGERSVLVARGRKGAIGDVITLVGLVIALDAVAV